MNNFITPNIKLYLLSIMIITFIIGFDTTSIGIAIVNIATEFNFSIKQSSWLSISYTAGFAAFLLPAGIITDKIGYYLIIVISTFAFILISLILTLCDTLVGFTTIRLIQGICASFLNTSALSLLNLLYPMSNLQERQKAFSKWSMCLGMSFALGPILGSLIIINFSWKWIMLINIPLGIVSLLPFIKNKILNTTKLQLNKVSLLSTMPVSCIILLLTINHNTNNIFYNYIIVTLYILCFILIIIFHKFLNNSFTKLSELKNFSFCLAMIFPIIFSISYWSLFIILPEYFHLKFDLCEFKTMFLMFLLSVPLILTPIININNLILGFLLISFGLILLSLIFYINNNFIFLGISMLLLGLGAAILNPILPRFVMDNVQAKNSGLATAIVGTLRQIGFAIGVALFSLLTDNTKLHFTESKMLIIVAFLPIIAIIIYINLNKKL